MSYSAAVAYWVSFVLGGFSGVFLSFGMTLQGILVGLISLVLFALVTRAGGMK